MEIFEWNGWKAIVFVVVLIGGSTYINISHNRSLNTDNPKSNSETLRQIWADTRLIAITNYMIVVLLFTLIFVLGNE